MRSLTIVTILSLVIADGAEAQTLTPGTWTGLMSPPGLAAVEISYDVQTVDSLTIDVHTNGPAGIIPAGDISIEDDALKFTMGGLGIASRCTLLRQPDHSYSGECLNPNSAIDAPRGRLTMVPPAAVIGNQ